MIKAILFDFGGTLDTGGDHWYHILYDILNENLSDVGQPLDRALYKKAFAFGERTLATEPIIKITDNFYDLLEKKMLLQFKYLQENGVSMTDVLAKDTANKAYGFAKKNCQRSGRIVATLKQQYKVALVSNFYGNLKTVLADFQLDNLFACVIESAVVGVKKPDPQIFRLACQALGLSAKDCAVVGDSLKKDIEVAMSIGCRTYWLRGRGWGDELMVNDSSVVPSDLPYETLDNLNELETLLAQIS